MLTQDAALHIAYAKHPEMLLRLAEFVGSYGLTDKPALIFQASEGMRNADRNIADSAIKIALKHDTKRNVAWWNGFHSSLAARPVFRGWANWDARNDPQWALEMHRDGSCIAGVWAFPSGHDEAAEHCLHDFYATAFEDFAEMALLLAAESKSSYVLTATLLHANCLPFVRGNGVWSGSTVPAPRLSTLQWPLRAVSQPDAWHAAITEMNIELFGAYGLAFEPEAR